MEMNGATLPRRVIMLLRAKLHLALFAIALHLLDFAAPLMASWLLTRRSAAALLDKNPTLLGALGDGGGAPLGLVAAAAVVFLTVALTAFFRAGYIRSLVGRFHLAPADRAQFRAMTDLVLVVAVIDWLASAAASAALDRLATEAQQQAALLLVQLVALVTLLVLLYADYAIVVSGLGFVAAVRRSWQTVEANRLISVGVILVAVLASGLIVAATTVEARPLIGLLPLLAAQVVVLGLVAFLADVVLIVVYIDSMERRRIPDVTG
jgi:hypothetical protein